MKIYIGIDLAWGEKNLSGFCVLLEHPNSLEVLEVKLLLTLEEILKNIKKYNEYEVAIGIDAPLLIPNESGNREIEKAFNRDFAQYKIAMLPVNRHLFFKYSKEIRSEKLFESLKDIGFTRDINAKKSVFEVYPHATIAVNFNKYKILPYKRKKGRDILFIKKQLKIYQNYLQSIVQKNTFFDVDIEMLKGKKVKEYEDMLDAITCAYTPYISKRQQCKIYQLDGIDTFITPI